MQVDPFHVEADQLDYHADHEAQRRRLALAKVHPEDVLALAMDQTTSQHCLRPCGMKPTVLDPRNLLNFHSTARLYW